MNANLILAVLLSLATTALGRAPVPKVDPVQRDRAALQGTWSTVSVQSGDHASGEDTAETLTYKWNTYTQSRNGRPYSSGTFKIIDAKSKPKQIEFTVTDGSDKGRTTGRSTSSTVTSTPSVPSRVRTARRNSPVRRASTASPSG